MQLIGHEAPMLQEFHALVENEDALKAVEKNASGSRPKELFEDVLEEIEEAYVKDRSLLRDAKFELHLETPYPDFVATVEASSIEKVAAISDGHRLEASPAHALFSAAETSQLYMAIPRGRSGFLCLAATGS